MKHKNIAVEHYKKVLTRQTKHESVKLDSFNKQKMIIAAAKINSKIGPLNVNSSASSAAGVGTSEESSTDIIDISFKFSTEKPTLNGLLDNLGKSSVGGGSVGVGVGVGGLVDDSIEIYNSLTDASYELDEIETIQNFLAFIENNKIKTITNVYQEVYSANKNATGLGDYLRGNYFLMQFCQYIQEVYNITIQFNFIINHPLNEFLKNGGNRVGVGVGVGVESSDENAINSRFCDIVCFDRPNWIDSHFSNNGLIIDSLESKSHVLYFMNYLIHDALLCGVGDLYIYTISFPLWPKKLVEWEHSILRNFMCPNTILNKYVEHKLECLLCRENQSYNVLHVRSGDSFLLGGDEDEGGDEDGGEGEGEGGYIERLLSLVKELTYCIDDSNDVSQSWSPSWLVLSDNNYVKDKIVGVGAGGAKMITFKEEIGHLGEGQIQTSTKIKNTLCDFYLMSKANKIISITSYKHGTGFSRWCAETYNIPYFCYYIAGK